MYHVARSLTLLMTILAIVLIPSRAVSEEGPEIQVYKLATCGCCRPWIKYMASEGFRVQATDMPDVKPLKQEKGIPNEYTSCHTAIVDGYVLEGHVSADDVRRLLAERPAIVGLLVPGMPKGSPGMEGPDPIAYDVLALNKDGSVSVYASHQPTPTADAVSPTATPDAATDPDTSAVELDAETP